MSTPDPGRSPFLQDKAFLVLLTGVTLAFGWVLLPFFGAVFWGVALAILFGPLNRWLLPRLGNRRNRTALLTLSIVLLMVILPLVLVTGSLVQEVVLIVDRVQKGEFSLVTYFEQITAALPPWVNELLDRFGLGNLASLQAKLTAALTTGSKAIASQAIGIGQNTFELLVHAVIALYLAFFLIRDGRELAAKVGRAVPLQPAYKRDLFEKFTTVIRATVKGNVVVALTQGALGGLAFWVLDVHAALLWAVLMAVLSLLPAVGAGLVWGPVAIYYLATGELGAGIGLVAYGVLVIGMVDNVLRPILVGKDTKMPDYLVLISTLGGLAIFGLNGFVIGPVIAAMFMAVWALFAEKHAPAAPPAEPPPA